MPESPPIAPVSLAERALTTALVPVLALLADQVPLPYTDAALLAHAHVHASPFSVGIGPFVTAFGLVELAALVVPRWRRLRHDARGRTKLERWAAAIAVAMAVAQGLTIAISLEANDAVLAPGWGTRLVIAATLAAGASAITAAARWATQRGLVNGYVLWWAMPMVIELARGGAFRAAAARSGDGARDVAILAVALAVVVGATIVAVAGGDAIPAALRVDGSAYRDGKTRAPRPWFPIPASSIQPLDFAVSVLKLPAFLATVSVPGMVALGAALQRDVVFDVADVALIVFGMFVAAWLLHRPDEVTTFVRRLGTASEVSTPAHARAALRRALAPTLVYLLVLALAAIVARSEATGEATIFVVAMTTGLGIDFVRSLRAHARDRDLVCVSRVHDAYAVPALRAALWTEGIDARPRGMAVLSLLQAFAPFAPVELFVRAGDTERASSLLRHWAAGDAKPVASPPPPPVRRDERPPLPPGTRALVLVGLGGLPIVAGLIPRPEEGPPPPRAQIAIVRVDDDADPLGALPGGVEPPEGVGVYSEIVSTSDQHPSRHYARVVLRRGESLGGAWARVLPWLQRLELRAGDRWAWEPLMEPDDVRTEGDAVASFHVVGLRTFLLTGEPVITTKDVDAADATQDPQTLGADVRVSLGPDGADRFYGFTQEWVGRRLAIVIDDHIESAPVVRGPIRGGKISITMGVGAPDEQLANARRLAASLR